MRRKCSQNSNWSAAMSDGWDRELGLKQFDFLQQTGKDMNWWCFHSSGSGWNWNIKILF